MQKRHVQFVLVTEIGSPCWPDVWEIRSITSRQSTECTVLTLEEEGQVLMALMLSCFYKQAAELFPLIG